MVRAVRQYAVAEVRLLLEEAERARDRELVEDLHDVLDRLKLLPAARVQH